MNSQSGPVDFTMMLEEPLYAWLCDLAGSMHLSPPEVVAQLIRSAHVAETNDIVQKFLMVTTGPQTLYDDSPALP